MMKKPLMLALIIPCLWSEAGAAGEVDAKKFGRSLSQAASLHARALATGDVAAATAWVLPFDEMPLIGAKKQDRRTYDHWIERIVKRVVRKLDGKREREPETIIRDVWVEQEKGAPDKLNARLHYRFFCKGETAPRLANVRFILASGRWRVIGFEGWGYWERN